MFFIFEDKIGYSYYDLSNIASYSYCIERIKEVVKNCEAHGIKEKCSDIIQNIMLDHKVTMLNKVNMQRYGKGKKNNDASNKVIIEFVEKYNEFCGVTANYFDIHNIYVKLDINDYIKNDPDFTALKIQ